MAIERDFNIEDIPQSPDVSVNVDMRPFQSEGVDVLEENMGTDEQGRPVKMIEGKRGYVKVTNPLREVQGFDQRNETYRPATGEFNIAKLQQEQYLKRKAVQDKAEQTVEGMLDFYPEEHAKMKIGQKWKTSADYGDYLASTGVNPKSADFFNRMNAYVQTQDDRLQEEGSRLQFYAMDVLGMNKEMATEYANKKIAKFQNDILDSGFKKYLPDYMEASGDKAEADALRAMDKKLYFAMNMFDDYTEAKEKNYRTRIKQKTVPTAFGPKTIAYQEFYDVNGNVVTDIKQAKFTPDKSSNLMQQFQTGMRELAPQLEEFLSDSNKEAFHHQAVLRQQALIDDIAKRNGMKPEQVIQNLKWVSRNEKLLDQDYLGKVAEDVLRPQAEADLKQSMTEAVLTDKRYQDIYTQVAADILDNKIGVAIPKSGVINPQKMARMAMDLRDRAIAEGVPENNISAYMEEAMVDMLMSATPSEDDDINIYRRRLARQVLKNQGIMTSMESEANKVRHEEALKEAELKQKKKDKDAEKQQKEADKMIVQKERDGSLWIDAMENEDARELAKYLKYDRNGNVNKGLFTALGYEYDESGKKIREIDVPKESDELFSKTSSNIDRTIANPNKSVYVLKPTKNGALTPEGYLEKYSLYSKGIANNQKELDEMRNELLDTGNMDMFLKDYARKGINLKDFRSVLFGEPPKLNKRDVISAKDYDEATSETNALSTYKSFMGKNDEAEYWNQDRGSFKTMLELYPKQVQKFANNQLDGVFLKVKTPSGIEIEKFTKWINGVVPEGDDVPTVEELAVKNPRAIGHLRAYPQLYQIYNNDKNTLYLRRMAFAIAMLNAVRKYEMKQGD